MISSIRGEVLATAAGWVVIDVSGVGFRIEVSGRLAHAHVGQELTLHTQLVVREDALTLFGFETPDELEVFNILLGVSGVGPRSALGVLTELTPGEVAQAAAREDEHPFRKVSGIGPKTAKFIAVQLAGKLQPGAYTTAISESQTTTQFEQTRVTTSVELGLLGLGYGEGQARDAVRDALEAGAPNDEAALLRAALQLLQAPRLARSSSPQQGSNASQDAGQNAGQNADQHSEVKR